MATSAGGFRRVHGSLRPGTLLNGTLRRGTEAGDIDISDVGGAEARGKVVRLAVRHSLEADPTVLSERPERDLRLARLHLPRLSSPA
jgi:hypothetical protein